MQPEKTTAARLKPNKDVRMCAEEWRVTPQTAAAIFLLVLSIY
jgi:hypothetical protein